MIEWFAQLPIIFQSSIVITIIALSLVAFLYLALLIVWIAYKLDEITFADYNKRKRVKK